MQLRGRAHLLGDHVDTDGIIPARYLVTTDPGELARHCFEDLDPTLRERIRPGDILVAGQNFGQGSSREHAPIAIKGLGVGAVVARSFAGIFHRNACNVGLPLVECAEARDRVRDGDEVEVDLTAGWVVNHTRGERYAITPLPPFMRYLLQSGGIVEYVRAALAAAEAGGAAP
ncbi:MAG: 3-isopropylmalate dehydratase small subunit [Armatimonadota bacterium]|nr:3-isopropylmalate dehydratase small subunit [Armatimonadota bacterium]MDR7450017.1 3-isopropylmalate dehydratase small subunit [Armatimonadota bacterium]MDR7460185.1 3-isopropylmalate dehydratase small subunit [Armatimonadota bacterium]MDR7480731.1 3-isopropylmalate dehydratase small subunit [Armatimonadota bacterium]MDR7488923.1 3-isopropylmalate dehydratase small subunit [Armatimonadota bacterium]